MKLFRFLLRENSSQLLLASAIGVVCGLANAGIVAFVHAVWKYGTYANPKWIAAFVALLLVLVVTGTVSQLIVLSLSLRAVTELRLRLSGKMLATPLRRLEELGPPKLLAVLTDDVQVISRVLPMVPRLVIDVTTMVGCVAYMAYLSWSGLVVIALFTLVGVGVYRLLVNRALRHMRAGREVFDRVFEQFRALGDGLKQLKVNRDRRRAFLERDLHDAVEDFRERNYAGRALLIGAENVTRLLFFVVLGALMFAVPRIVGFDRPTLTGFVLNALFLYRPLGALMTAVPELARASVSLVKVEALGLSLEADSAEPEEAPPAEPAAWKKIELVGATYSYEREGEDSLFTVGPVDIAFTPGELVFVVGGNGGGKTTLAKLVTSLYQPHSGELRLDGEPVTDENVERYRQLFSPVFTDFYVFPELLRNRETDLDEVARFYLKKLRLDHKVDVDDGRLATTALSTGQRKRLALLAAYLEDRSFYVFDEWAADQDPEFKQVFYTKLLPELKQRGKTVLVITHDDRFLSVADRVLELEEGQVTEAVPEPSGEALP